MQELRKIDTCCENLLKAMTMRAEIEIEVCMPGYAFETPSSSYFKVC